MGGRGICRLVAAGGLGTAPPWRNVRTGLRLSFGASNCSSVHHLLPFSGPTRRDPGPSMRAILPER